MNIEKITHMTVHSYTRRGKDSQVLIFINSHNAERGLSILSDVFQAAII